jgi:DNA-binding LacI/PurR family transcriptional regulator
MVTSGPSTPLKFVDFLSCAIVFINLVFHLYVGIRKIQMSVFGNITLSFLQGSQDKVALLGNDMRYIVNQSRHAGFQLAVNSLKYPEENIFLRTGLDKPAQCAAAVNELLNLGVRRFLCMDEDICMYTLTALMRAGKKIPEDVQLASLFDSEKLSSSPIGISALLFDSAELGKTACRELLKCLKDENYDPAPMLGYRIISRESTM